VIEVDGASHYRKYSSDRSRDRLLEDCGVCYVDRIDAVDTADPKEVEAFVRRFLDKLAA
jgi:very-short-patch-repair endonuclease